MKLFCNIIIILSLFIFFAGPVVSAGYFDLISSGVTKAEAGLYDEAASDAYNASLQDNTDPLSHYLMAVIYMHTGNFPNAEKEIQKAIASNLQDWRGHYALALIDIHSKKYESASAHLSEAMKNPSAEYHVKPLINYFDYLAAKKFDETSIPFDIPLDLLVFAMNHMKLGNNDHALAYLKKINEFEKQLGYSESRSPFVSFDAEKPLIFPYKKLKWKISVPKNATTISGKINIQADASSSSGIKYVSVYIDDSFVGTSNVSPYNYSWNTANYTNGYHKIKMDGKNEAGSLINSKTIWVNVKNENAFVPEPKTGKVADTLMNRIWNMIKISESRLVMHYNMALIYIKSGDTENAIKELEFVQGYKPGYRDSLKLLKDMKVRRNSYSEIHQGPVNSKKIALTFDDGPNERTQEMLDMLETYKVPATFFIVGYVAETQPDMVKKMHSLGHEIENHSYSHRRFNTITDDEIEPELAKGAAIIKEITGKSSLYFRPPGGHSTEALKKAAENQGLTGVFWTIMCSAYEGERYENLAAHVLNNIKNGAIILMHNGEPATTSALATLIPELKSRGYEFVTLDDLLSSDKPSLHQAKK